MIPMLRLLQGLSEKRIIEDADVGRAIVSTHGQDRKEVERVYNMLKEEKLIKRLGKKNYRVNVKKIRKILDNAGY